MKIRQIKPRHMNFNLSTALSEIIWWVLASASDYDDRDTNGALLRQNSVYSAPTPGIWNESGDLSIVPYRI